MASATDLIEPLSAVVMRCVEHRAYGYAGDLCRLLGALDSGRWDGLPSDEQDLWLSRLQEILHVRALGDQPWAAGDPHYERAHALTAALVRARSSS